MFCGNCGTENKDNATFCANCGTKLLKLNENSSDKTELLDDRTVFLPENQVEQSSVANAQESYNQENEPLQEKNNDYSENLQNNNTEKENYLGIYKIIKIIGQGGGGIVYKAVHTRLNKEVVIKQIKNPNGGFNRQETDLLKEIKHTYLPQVLDFIEQDGQAFTVMDFISGSDLEKLAKSGHKFRSKEIIKIATQLCEAVSYLHTRKPPIIHSDIKPANVMLSENGDICLIDFNVSLAFEKNVSVIGGTVGFAPPEQLGIPIGDIKNGIGDTLPIKKIQPVVNERSDVYSIGALLQFLVTGEMPAKNYKTASISKYAKVPDGLVQIIRKATMLEPSKRYKNASEMLIAVKNINKLDRRYRAIKIRRSIVTVIAVILMAGSVVLNREGVRKLAEEHEEKYQDYITEIVNNIDSGDYSEAKELIQTASEFEPARIEPYYNYEKILYADKDYENCMNYPETVLNSEITQNELNDLGLIAEMYMMSADSAFELEDYGNAITLYNKTLSYSDKLVECYRDLTISYARLGNIEEAEQSLEKAEQLGISDDRLKLMQGEIHSAKGETTEAYDCFTAALEQTDDDYIRFRALLVCDKTMLADTGNAAANAQKMITLLKEQESKVSLEYAGVVKEMLANEYAVAEDFENAASCYQSLFDDGILSYTLQKNYFNILYSKLQSYEQCLALLGQMKAQNADDYWVDMNLSYTYIAVENAKADQLRRNYSNAYSSYKTAAEEYKVYAQNGKGDANMDRLKGLIDDLIAYGWIEEE